MKLPWSGAELSWSERIRAAIEKVEDHRIDAALDPLNEVNEVELASAKALWDRHSLEERRLTAPHPALRAFVEKVEEL